jgi:hypothetical protein
MSPQKLHAHLSYAWILCRPHYPKGAAGEVATGIIELGMIEQVEELSPEK